MAFFKINNPKYDANKIEGDILNSLQRRKIKKEEREFVDNYDVNIWTREILSSPIVKLKLVFLKLPRWMIKLAKVLPFYEIVRNFIYRKFLQIKIP